MSAEMTLLVKLPGESWASEKRYIAEWVLQERLGIPVRFEIGVSSVWELRYGKNVLRLPNLFFPETKPETYLTRGSLPSAPFAHLTEAELAVRSGSLCESRIPVLWQNNQSDSKSLDIFGTIFFLITRYEEVCIRERDSLERFLSGMSISTQGGFLGRPLVDEYIEILSQWLRETAGVPNWIERHPPQYKFILTHDVDVPSRWKKRTPFTLVRALASDLIKKQDPVRAIQSWQGFFDPDQDHVSCFNWMMDTAEKYSLQSTYYFIAGGEHPHDYEIHYNLKEPYYLELLKRMTKRGHRIGIHGSFESYLNPELLRSEIAYLSEASQSEITLGRQHYLRFLAPETWHVQELAGLKFDSSIGYSDQSGFRAGTCFEYPVFDVKLGKKLEIREQPLIVMEHSLLSSVYEGLSHPQAFEKSKLLLDRVKKFGGQFVFLWHNHNLVKPADRELFEQILNLA